MHWLKNRVTGCDASDVTVRNYPETGEYLCDKCAKELKRKK